MSDLPGYALQRVVRLIETAVANNPLITVESPRRMRDLQTGKPREHDVVVTVVEGHHRLLVALECRDRSRPVGVPEVEAFSKKCDGTGIDKGIIVSSKGFTRTARLKAQANGIGCFTLKPAAQLEWMKTNVFHQVLREKRSVSLRLSFSNGIKPDLSEAKYYFGDGTELTRQGFLNIASNALGKLHGAEPLAFMNPEATYRARVELELDDTLPAPYAVVASGERYEIEGGYMDVIYRVHVTEIPFEFHTYSDILKEVGITQAAIATFTLNNRNAHLVAVSSDDGTKQMKVVVDSTRKRSRRGVAS